MFYKTTLFSYINLLHINLLHLPSCLHIDVNMCIHHFSSNIRNLFTISSGSGNIAFISSGNVFRK